tara:strand:- start:2636 stop:3364 length:729 start_codon:yes stop_codon:yes gene_type:complete
MAVETAVYLSGLVPAQPTGTSVVSEGQGHIRIIKTTLQNSLPNVNEAVNAIHTRATAPTSKTPGTVWFDTSADVLKIWNEADSAWVTLSVNPAANYGSVGTQVFYANSSGGTSLTSGSEDLVAYAGEEIDVDSAYDTSTSKWTPVSGYYFIHATVNLTLPSSVAAATKTIIPIIYKNGSKEYEGAMTCIPINRYSNAMSATVSALVNSNGTDYWQIHCYQNSGLTASTEVGNATRFMGVRVA